MGTLDHCIKHLIETDLKVCSENLGTKESENPLVHRLKVAEEMFKEDGSDSVGHWIGILYATTTIYALTLHTGKISITFLQSAIYSHTSTPSGHLDF